MAAAQLQTSTNDRLSFTAFIAIAIHALLIFALGFKIQLGQKIAPALNITLATHKSELEPEKADFLAQQNQMASGESETVKELLARDQAEFAAQQAKEVMPSPQEKSSIARQAQKELLTTTNDSAIKVLDPKKTQENEDKEDKEAQDQDIPITNPDKAALLAKRDRLNQEEAQRPRIRRMTAVSAKSSDDAAYLNEWNTRVEEIGNKNFPRAALTQRLFGTMRIAVAINANGSIHNTEIISPSEHDILNQAALQIVHLAAPFKPIPTNVLDGHDKLEIIRTWTFEITGLTSTATQTR